jgi:mannose-6-phosphate isomerase-like protein (cupin superfamily)
MSVIEQLSQEVLANEEHRPAEKLSLFSEHFKPRTVGQFNGHDLMVAKAEGSFVWHKHEETDDFFLVLKGRLTIQMREGT